MNAEGGEPRSSESGSPPPNGDGRKVVGRPFQPGVSGNPSGRPRIEPRVRRYARRYDRRMLKVLAELAEDKSEPASERRRAANDVIAIGGGKPVAEFVQEVAGRDGAPLVNIDMRHSAAEPVTPESVLAAYRAPPPPVPAPVAAVEHQPRNHRMACAEAVPQGVLPEAREEGGPAATPAAAPGAPRPPHEAPVIDVTLDETGAWSAPAPPPPHPEILRVMSSLASSGDPAELRAARQRAEATVRARITQEARLERSMGRSARADELLAKLPEMGL
jgi:hypothetical protein